MSPVHPCARRHGVLASVLQERCNEGNGARRILPFAYSCITGATNHCPVSTLMHVAFLLSAPRLNKIGTYTSASLTTPSNTTLFTQPTLGHLGEQHITIAVEQTYRIVIDYLFKSRICLWVV